jgi:transcriptional regulator
MYVPKPFQVTDPEIIDQFIRENGFATLISKSAAFPSATHIPLELAFDDHGNKVLHGHISKDNPQWQEFRSDPNVLVIFLSPLNQYISSSWYNHPNAPTWNYMSVQVTGKLEIIEGEKLLSSIIQLTNRYEQNSAHPVSWESWPEEVKQQINGVVGFEITIIESIAAFKLSQNRSEEDFKQILKELKSKTDPTAKLIAEVMKRHRNAHS